MFGIKEKLSGRPVAKPTLRNTAGITFHRVFSTNRQSPWPGKNADCASRGFLMILTDAVSNE